jgi:adhesin transport system outer membrane protein
MYKIKSVTLERFVLKTLTLLLCLVTIILAPSDSTAQETGRVTLLRDAVASGISANPQYAISSSRRRTSDEELRQARSLYFPSVDLQGDVGLEYSDDEGTRGGIDPHEEDHLGFYDTGITLTQMLFDGWETRYENRKQAGRVVSSAHRVRETTELIGVAIVEAYMEVLRQRELLKIAQENVAQHVLMMEQIKDSAMHGRTPWANVSQVKARLAAAEAQEASIIQSLGFAESSYIREVGETPRNLAMPIVPFERLFDNVEMEVNAAIQNSSTLAIFEADIQVANAEYEAAKSAFYPQLDLRLNAREGKDLSGVRGRDTSASAAVTMSWNLYRGGGDTARVRELINRAAESRATKNDAARSVERDVRQTWARMMAAKDRARQFSLQVQANQELVNAYKDQFNLNRRTLLDVLNTQNELFIARNNAVNSEFLEILAVYRLLALRSNLLESLDIGYPREADPAKM